MQTTLYFIYEQMKKPIKMRIKAVNWAYINQWIMLRGVGWMIAFVSFNPTPLFVDGRSGIGIKIILFVLGAALGLYSHWKLSGIIETHKDEYYK